jgi:hypothetical protein
VEWEISWDGDPENVRVTTSGKVTVEALDEWVQAALADPRYRPGMLVLADHRNSDWAHLTTDQVRRRVDLIALDADRIVGHRVAWVVGKKIDYATGLLMQAFGAGRINFEWEVFDDIDRARAWLREPGRPPGHEPGLAR